MQKSQLVSLEIAQQTEDLSVEPDQSHSEAKSYAPSVLSRSTSADHAVSLIKVGQEGQGTKNEADKREDELAYDADLKGGRADPPGSRRPNVARVT